MRSVLFLVTSFSETEESAPFVNWTSRVLCSFLHPFAFLTKLVLDTTAWETVHFTTPNSPSHGPLPCLLLKKCFSQGNPVRHTICNISKWCFWLKLTVSAMWKINLTVYCIFSWLSQMIIWYGTKWCTAWQSCLLTSETNEKLSVTISLQSLHL